MISKTFSWLAVLKSLLIAASRPSEFSLHKFSRRVSWSIRHSYDLVASESKYAFCLLKISWNEFIQVSLWVVRVWLCFAAAFLTRLLHSEHHSEACLAIHHSFVCFLGFCKRKCFDHWTDSCEYAEIKRVLSLDRSFGESAHH